MLIEKVKDGLKCCTLTENCANCDDCPYEEHPTSDCIAELLKDCNRVLNQGAE